MEKKQYKVVPYQDGGQIAWEIVRVGHQTKGDYIFATFYDRGALQLFSEALENKGFELLESK